MPYNFKGKLRIVFPSTSGISKNSGKEWTRKSAVFSAYEMKYGDSTELFVYVNAWNKECIFLSDTEIGKECEVTCRVESREFNGKWSTDLILEKIMFTDMFSPQPSQRQMGQPEDLPLYPKVEDEEDDQLPF